MSHPPPYSRSLLNPTDAQEKERAGEAAPAASLLLVESASPFVLQQAGTQGKEAPSCLKRDLLCARCSACARETVEYSKHQQPRQQSSENGAACPHVMLHRRPVRGEQHPGGGGGAFPCASGYGRCGKLDAALGRGLLAGVTGFLHHESAPIPQISRDTHPHPRRPRQDHQGTIMIMMG